ncbi:MAG TPA: hypothetical protein VHE61_24580 [Opitutaceae bacterium]|nr:hypothetical protein [Opitutaceae bacterium]
MALVLLAALAGCNSTSGSGPGPGAGVATTTAPSPMANVISGGNAPTIVQAPAGTTVYAGIAVQNLGYCPPVQIRAGTEALVIYDKGHDGDPNSIRYQASISKTARECHTAGSSMMIKVGVAGRLVAGPKGTAGNFAVPVRVAVVAQHDNKVFFSQVMKQPVALSAPDYGSDFSAVMDNIAFDITPDDHDLIIYVGFDGGAPKQPPAPSG